MEAENEIIVVLLHDEQLPYEDYIERINGHQLARRVKLADLAHNSNESHLAKIDATTKQRLAKYQRALDVLNTEEYKQNNEVLNKRRKNGKSNTINQKIILQSLHRR